jgi:hypothetical protein
VVESGDEREVPDSVVELVLVSVVELEAVGDGSVLALPNNVVDESLSAIEGGPVVSLGSDVSDAGRVAASRAGSCHAATLPHRHGSLSPAARSAADAFDT